MLSKKEWDAYEFLTKCCGSKYGDECTFCSGEDRAVNEWLDSRDGWKEFSKKYLTPRYP